MPQGRRNPNPAGHKAGDDAADKPKTYTITSPNVYFKHEKEIKATRKELDDAQMLHAGAYKAAKKDGIDNDVLKLMMKLDKMAEDKRGTYLRLLREYVRIKKWDAQPDLLEAAEAPAVPKEKGVVAQRDRERTAAFN